MKSAIQFALMFTIAAGVVMHLACWFFAYHSVPKIEKASRASVISPWWLFNKDLLPPQHDSWRIKALYAVAAYVLAAILLWYFFPQA